MDIFLYSNEIRNLNPLEQRLFYRHNHWLEFDFKNQHVHYCINYITENYPNGITRNNIIDYLKVDNSSLLIGFLLTMIWGHGFSMHGRADNRGPWKVNKMLANFDNSIEILENSKKHLLKNDLISAHLEFNDMERCRVNFFSKYLYFLGRALEMKNYPLIFDARVAKSIGQLNVNNIRLFEILDIQPKQDALSFVNYVNEIHKLAHELNLPAENIEYFLFNGV